MGKIFKKNDIKAGYLLRVKNTVTGREFNMTVINGLTMNSPELGCCDPGKNWWPLKQFNDQLHTYEFEVVAVYGYAPNKYLLDNSIEGRALLWERKPEPVKMTVAEIAEKLGHPVEIVEG